jgi:cytochrome c oxidase assembly protein subunit 15
VQIAPSQAGPYSGKGPQPGALERALAASPAVARWLLGCAGLVVAVLLVGGITRLTHSGLSIVHWQPVTGAWPPLSGQDWARLFEQYRSSPEFRLVNPDITIEGFKAIFWWEYAHRLLGRLAGLAFLLPWLWFVASRRISRSLAWRLAGIFALGGLQGALGWAMVASGLVDNPHVSPLRLVAHLGLALALIAAMLWTAWGLTAPPARRRVPPTAAGAVAAVFVMALSGALVAGTGAGHVFNSFPLMQGHLVPPDLLRLTPWTLNLRYNLATIQFIHRAIALALLVLIPALWWHVRRCSPAPQARLRSNLMLAALLLQVSLGIGTLLSVVAVPLAAAHQAGAVLLFASVLWTAHALALTPGLPGVRVSGS